MCIDVVGALKPLVYHWCSHPFPRSGQLLQRAPDPAFAPGPASIHTYKPGLQCSFQKRLGSPDPSNCSSNTCYLLILLLGHQTAQGNFLEPRCHAGTWRFCCGSSLWLPVPAAS